MTDKTRWLGLGPWHEDNESELIDWTAQPQYKGLVKGDYYHAELRYSGRWGDPGHKGELDVVFDDDGKIAFNPAVELSYLDSYQQRAVLDAMALNDCTPSHAQSIRLKKLAQEGLLTGVQKHWAEAVWRRSALPLSSGVNSMTHLLPLNGGVSCRSGAVYSSGRSAA